ncbi:hypothetical protein KM043_007519 [Ampulex compressa]|nr:hypothetical protein KM043_007519 [Ampulex compressa]
MTFVAREEHGKAENRAVNQRNAERKGRGGLKSTKSLARYLTGKWLGAYLTEGTADSGEKAREAKCRATVLVACLRYTVISNATRSFPRSASVQRPIDEPL